MRAARMLASGDLQLIILALLSEKPRHGYEIIKAVEEHSSGIYTPSPGVVYPALTCLEEMGFAASEQDGTKKLYRITDAGAEHLKKNHASVDEMLDQIARFGRKMSDFRKQYVEAQDEAQDEADDDARGDSGSESRHRIKGEWRQAKMEFRIVREELKAALYEKLDVSADERKRIVDVLRRAIAEIRAK
jgi:DNA-binding PadR family transcriptional regulator